jgi:hypothetical protein
MYVDSLLDQEGKEVCVVGKLEKVEQDIVFLRVGKKEVLVKHNGLDSYKTNIVRVKGVVENGILQESTVYKLSDDFDLEYFNRFVAVNKNFSEIF